MDTKTGELTRMNASSAVANGFTPVPKRHEKEADEILGDADSAMADMTVDTPLVAWATRHHQKKTTNRKNIQKASKIRNRKK